MQFDSCTVTRISSKQTSGLLPSLQNSKTKQSCLCSTTTTTSHIHTNIYFQNHRSAFFNDETQSYDQHPLLDPLTIHNNSNGLPEFASSTSDYSTSLPSSPRGTEQILMILMCNGMTPEFDQFNSRFSSNPKLTNRLRSENVCTVSVTPLSTPSSSTSSPICDDIHLKDGISLKNINSTTLVSSHDNRGNTILNSQPNNSVNAAIDTIPKCDGALNETTPYHIESSNKLDENMTLPPSPCVSDTSETYKNSIQDTGQPGQETPNQIESKIITISSNDSIHSSTAHHGETTDESSDDEIIPPKEKLPKSEQAVNKHQKTMKPELQLDSAESSGSFKTGKTYSFRDATINILTQVGKPMTAVDITKYIFEYKMVKSEGKTPERTVAAMIYQEMKKKKEVSEFALFGSGIFGLSAWKSDDHTSQDTASVSTDASFSSQKSVDRNKKKEKKKRKLTKKESIESESEDEISIQKRKPRRMHKQKPVSDEYLDECEQLVQCKKRKHSPDVVVTESDLFRTYITKLKKKEQDQIDEDECFVCKNGGELICCDYAGCMKVYHPYCVGLKEVPQGDWVCPHHFCSECKNPSVKKCFTCPFSVCDEHVTLMKDKIDMEKHVCNKCKQLCDNIK